jgi:hypothetical protein
MTAKIAHRKDPPANKAHAENLVGHHFADFVSAPLLETCLERLELPQHIIRPQQRPGQGRFLVKRRKKKISNTAWYRW